MKRLTVLLLALGLGGCMTDYSAKDRLLNAAREYNDGVRWGRYESAADHLPADRRRAFIDRHKNLEEELEISDAEVISIDLEGAKKDRAKARVEYVWSLKRQGLIEKTATEQVWEQKGSTWILASETRTKGEPLTLFDEPVREKQP
jgi:hypothetical protein